MAILTKTFAFSSFTFEQLQFFFFFGGGGSLNLFVKIVCVRSGEFMLFAAIINGKFWLPSMTWSYVRTAKLIV